MASIRIEDLPTLETMNADEADQVAGRGRRLGVEALERREVPATLAIASATVLTNQALINPVVVNPTALTLNLTITGTDVGDVVTVTGTSGNLRVTMNNVTKSYFVNYGRITFDGKGGDDDFTNDTSVPVLAHGGPGNDVLTGGSGADTLYGDDGKDTLDGGAGNDVLYAAATEGGLEGSLRKLPNAQGEPESYSLAHAYNTFVVNHLFGGSGDDVLYGSAYNDNLTGRGGSDKLYGYGGQDLLHGDGGTAAAGIAADVAGNDELHGGPGVDAMVGHKGDDHLYADAQWRDSDLLTTATERDNVRTRLGNGELVYEPAQTGDFLFGDSDDVKSYVGDGNDKLVGGDHTDFLYGGGGIDQLEGGLGADWLQGGDGDDTLYGGNVGWREGGSAYDVDFLLGEDGADTLHSEDGGQDHVEGGKQRDVIYTYNDDVIAPPDGIADEIHR